MSELVPSHINLTYEKYYSTNTDLEMYICKAQSWLMRGSSVRHVPASRMCMSPLHWAMLISVSPNFGTCAADASTRCVSALEELTEASGTS